MNNNFNDQLYNKKENNDINFEIIKNIKTIGDIFYKKRKMYNNYIIKERNKNNLQNNLIFKENLFIKNFLNKFKDVKTQFDIPTNFKTEIFKNFTKNSKYQFLYNIQIYTKFKNNLNKNLNQNKNEDNHNNNKNNITINNNKINNINNINNNNINNNINNNNINNNNFNNNNFNNNNFNNINNNKDYYKEIENSIYHQKEMEEKNIFQQKKFNIINNLKQKYLGKKHSNEEIIENDNLNASKIFKIENKENKIYVHNTTINIYNNIINNENQNDIIKNEENELINNNDSLVQYIGGKIRIKNISEDENTNLNTNEDLDEKLILDIKKNIIENGKKYSKEQSKNIKKYKFEFHDYKFEIIINKEINKISNVIIKNHKNNIIKNINNYNEIIEFLKKIKIELGNVKNCNENIF